MEAPLHKTANWIKIIDSKLTNLWPGLRWIFLFIAISHQIFYLVDHSRITYDEMLQIGAAHSFLDGHGLTIRRSSVAELPFVEDKPLLRIFPPTYALMIAYLYKITGDFGWADFYFKVVASIVFFFAWFLILEGCPRLTASVKTFIWFYWSCIFSPLMVSQWTAHSTGMLSLAFFSANIACCLYGARQDKARILLYAMGGIFMGLAMALRYAYVPFGAILPLSLFLYHMRKDRRLQNGLLGAIINGVAAGAVCLAFFSYNYIHYGQFVYLAGRSASPQWQNLLMFIPFPSHVLGLMGEIFFKTREVAQEISLPSFFPTSLLILISLVIVFIFFDAFINYARNAGKDSFRHDDKGKNLLSFLFIIGMITLFITLAFLIHLSIKSETNSLAGGWTYLSELRYYDPLYCFFMIGIAMKLLEEKKSSPGLPYKIYHKSVWLLVIVSLAVVGAWRMKLDADQVFREEKFQYGIEKWFGHRQPIAEVVEKQRAINREQGKTLVVMVEETNQILRGVVLASGAVYATYKSSDDLTMIEENEDITLLYY